jgi:hypothetical protein
MGVPPLLVEPPVLLAPPVAPGESAGEQRQNVVAPSKTAAKLEIRCECRFI